MPCFPLNLYAKKPKRQPKDGIHAWDRVQRVCQQELGKGESNHPGGDEDRAANSGQEASHQQNADAVLVKIFLDLLAFGRRKNAPLHPGPLN